MHLLFLFPTLQAGINLMVQSALHGLIPCREFKQTHTDHNNGTPTGCGELCQQY